MINKIIKKYTVITVLLWNNLYWIKQYLKKYDFTWHKAYTKNNTVFHKMSFFYKVS